MKARRNLRSPSGNQNQLWWRFVLQVAPVVLLAGSASAIAFIVTPGSDQLTLTLILTSLTILSFIAMLTFREQDGWNLALMLVFSVGLGSTFAYLSNESTQVIGYRPLWVVILCLVIGGSVGRWIGSIFAELGTILWLVSWAYLVGWATLVLFKLDPVFYLTWSVVGLTLFTGLSGVWFANMGRTLGRQSSVSGAIDLYLLCINLYFAATILLSTKV